MIVNSIRLVAFDDSGRFIDLSIPDAEPWFFIMLANQSFSSWDFLTTHDMDTFYYAAVPGGRQEQRDIAPILKEHIVLKIREFMYGA